MALESRRVFGSPALTGKHVAGGAHGRRPAVSLGAVRQDCPASQVCDPNGGSIGVRS